MTTVHHLDVNTVYNKFPCEFFQLMIVTGCPPFLHTQCQHPGSSSMGGEHHFQNCHPRNGDRPLLTVRTYTAFYCWVKVVYLAGAEDRSIHAVENKRYPIMCFDHTAKLKCCTAELLLTLCNGPNVVLVYKYAYCTHRK